jgi:pimeloyl-ACP methyl ester carboxylesterase
MQKKYTFMCTRGNKQHALTVHEWGQESEKPPVICVHGLARLGQDFAFVGQALSLQGRKTYAIDLLGRGDSDWGESLDDYTIPNYFADMQIFLQQFEGQQIDYIGTSLGGILGMMLAALPNSPIRRLVLNDVGPFIPKESLQRIAKYVRPEHPIFESVAQAAKLMKPVFEPFGPMSAQMWQRMARTSLRAVQGGYTLHYDPKIATAFVQGVEQDIALWPAFEAISCPVLVLRGEKSDLLTEATADEMLERGQDCEIVVMPECGHAPSLLHRDHVEEILDFMERPMWHGVYQSE